MRGNHAIAEVLQVAAHVSHMLAATFFVLSWVTLMLVCETQQCRRHSWRRSRRIIRLSRHRIGIHAERAVHVQRMPYYASFVHPYADPCAA